MHNLYFDCAATSPLLPEVKNTIMNHLDIFGNPSSLHRLGIEAEKILRNAREQVHWCLGAPLGTVVFTSSGTESNNMAILGIAKRFSNRGKHMVTTKVEHSCVLGAFESLEKAGWDITYVDPDPDGSIPASRVLNAVTKETVLVSVMHVNNETGAIFPVREIADGLKERGRALLHVDGTQAFGKIPLGDSVDGADLYSLSGHKIGAMKGIGALYIRKGLDLPPLLYGGGQEFGLRSGTQNLSGAVSLGEAAKIAMGKFACFNEITHLSNKFLEGLEQIPGCDTSRPKHASPYIMNVTFTGLRGEVLLHAFEESQLYVSTGAACTSNRKGKQGSHVLKAMGRTSAEVEGAIRFSIGWWTTKEDIEAALAIVRDKTQWLRGLLG